MIAKRCATCGRFGSYEDDDAFCIGCGHESLASACACGRAYEYALEDHGVELHCLRCGRRLRGRSSDIE